MSVEDHSLSVSECVNQIKHNLEGQFRNISIVGEISNLSLSSGSHWYFTLSDKDSSLSAALFKIDALRNPLINKLKNGDKVICMGSISVYQKRGSFQLVVKRILPAGKGDLKAQYEKLKAKLESEGLFDLERKKAIPQFARQVAVITALRGAALQDFLNIYRRRALFYHVVVIASAVQGDDAPMALRGALEKAIGNHLKGKNHFDVIVITRGGGSLEDLWAFNDEGLAWDIFNCPIPIISAVGHQVDFTICDFVADFRAETPSAAAEILTSSQIEVKGRFENAYQRMIHLMEILPRRKSEELMRFRPQKQLGPILNQLKQGQRTLEYCSKLTRIENILKIPEKNYMLDELFGRMTQFTKDQHQNWRHRLKSATSLLEAMGPQSVLKRGFSYLKDNRGKLVTTLKDYSQVDEQAKLKITFWDGEGVVRKTE